MSGRPSQKSVGWISPTFHFWLMEASYLARDPRGKCPRARMQLKSTQKNVLAHCEANRKVSPRSRRLQEPYLSARLAIAYFRFPFVFRPVLSQVRICAVTASAIETLAFCPRVGTNTLLKSIAIPFDGCATISAGFNGFARHTGRTSMRTLSTGHRLCSSRNNAPSAGRTCGTDTGSPSNETNASHSRPPTRRILAIGSPRKFGSHGTYGD